MGRGARGKPKEGACFCVGLWASPFVCVCVHVCVCVCEREISSGRSKKGAIAKERSVCASVCAKERGTGRERQTKTGPEREPGPSSVGQEGEIRAAEVDLEGGRETVVLLHAAEKLRHGPLLQTPNWLT